MAEFTVSKLHLSMLKKLNFTSDEGYGPSVDPKRPYGNKNVLDDILELYIEGTGYEVVKLEDEMGFLILDGDRVVARGGQGGPTDIEPHLMGYHRSMSTVLEILTQNLSIEEGVYENLGHTVWRLKGAATPRRVLVAVAGSLTSTDQCDVDAALERVLRPTDAIYILPANINSRIVSFAERNGRSLVEEEYDGGNIDLALAIFDPLMERGNDANGAPRRLMELAENELIPATEEKASPARP